MALTRRICRSRQLLVIEHISEVTAQKVIIRNEVNRSKVDHLLLNDKRVYKTESVAMQSFRSGYLEREVTKEALTRY